MDFYESTGCREGIRTNVEGEGEEEQGTEGPPREGPL